MAFRHDSYPERWGWASPHYQIRRVPVRQALPHWAAASRTWIWN